MQCFSPSHSDRNIQHIEIKQGLQICSASVSNRSFVVIRLVIFCSYVKYCEKNGNFEAKKLLADIIAVIEFNVFRCTFLCTKVLHDTWFLLLYVRYTSDVLAVPSDAPFC